MTRAPDWAAERTVDPVRAADLVGRARPELRGAPVTALGTGWDNTVHLVGDTCVVRFPRRAVALPGFARELAVLPRIADLLPLPVPVPLWTATDDHADPWPFAGSRLVVGRELAEAGLPDPARGPVASALGRFLRALHGPVARTVVADLDLPEDPLDRAWPAVRAGHTDEALRALVDDGTWSGDPAVDRLLGEARALGRPTSPPVLVHGDLHVRHLLVDGTNAASGVIDWGDVCLADPAVDLAIGYAAFPGPARAALLAAYGAVGRERELRARALAVRLSALLARYAAGENRPALLAEALAGLRRAVT